MLAVNKREKWEREREREREKREREWLTCLTRKSNCHFYLLFRNCYNQETPGEHTCTCLIKRGLNKPTTRNESCILGWPRAVVDTHNWHLIDRDVIYRWFLSWKRGHLNTLVYYRDLHIILLIIRNLIITTFLRYRNLIMTTFLRDRNLIITLYLRDCHYGFQFSGCWLILSVYILMSFDFPFVRLFGVR